MREQPQPAPSPAAAPAALTLADLRPGQVFETGSLVVGRDEIVAFATAFDPQPMHLDEAAAGRTMFGQLVASGWQVAALTMRLMVEARPFGTTPLIGAEVERLRFRRPVPPGTRLRCRATVETLEDSPRSGQGYARLKVETLDADTGVTLLVQGWRMVLPEVPEQQASA
ncbi:MAG: MaoC/PaaZ C-terminal domain-containing protein [Geminicoccaceae bacterium]